MNTLFSAVFHPFDEFYKTLRSVIDARMTISTALDAVLPIATAVGNKAVLDAVIAWKGEFSPCHYGYGNGHMKQVFHPSPKFAFADAKQTQETIAWLGRKTKKNLSLSSNINSAYKALELLNFGETLMSLVGATKISGYVKTTGKPKPVKLTGKRLGAKGMLRLQKKIKTNQLLEKKKTCRAKLVLQDTSIAKTRKNLQPWRKLYFGDYKRALKFVSKFMGRLHTWFDAWMRAECAVIAKVGLVREVITRHEYDIKNYPLTLIFLALASSEFSKRKEFTLESQKQGGLNVYLKAIFDEIVESERDGLKYIAYMIPAKEIFEQVPEPFLSAISYEWRSWMELFSIVLDREWLKGVSKSSRRSMRVLPGAHYQRTTGKCVRRSGVNSNLWNVVSDSWNSGARFLRGIDIICKRPFVFWGKVLQLIANDQFQWGQCAGKGVGNDVGLFRELTKVAKPWHVVHPNFADEFDSTFALVTLFECARTQGVTNLNSWLDVPALRTAAVTVHRDLICGCPVPQMSQDLYDYVATVVKPFGATGWDTIKEKND